jgi:hypothetical protein
VYGTLSETGHPVLRGAHVRWLLREVLGYMESEGLKLTPLNRTHVEALRKAGEARGALSAILGDAAAAIADAGWPCKRQFGGRDEYWEYKCAVAKGRAGAARSTKAELAWGVTPPCLFAGVYFKRAPTGRVLPRTDDSWGAQILASDPAGDDARWEQEPVGSAECWVGRVMDIRDVIGASNQGETVAGFVKRVFREIEDARECAGR